MNHKVFISYSRKDKEIVTTIKAELNALTSASFLMCDYDVEGIPEQYVLDAVHGINECDVFLSPYINIPVGETYTRTFKNYTNGAANWNNFLVVLTNSDGTTEYSVLRADNFGWGTGYDACTPSGGQADWGEWLAAMDDAKVTVSVTNNGSTADVKCVMVGNDGKTYIQDYLGILIDGEDFYFHFTIEGGHLVFE